MRRKEDLHPIQLKLLRQSRFKPCTRPGHFLLRLKDCILLAKGGPMSIGYPLKAVRLGVGVEKEDLYPIQLKLLRQSRFKRCTRPSYFMMQELYGLQNCTDYHSRAVIYNCKMFVRLAKGHFLLRLKHSCMLETSML